jgi:hypothetical protein
LAGAVALLTGCSLLTDLGSLTSGGPLADGGKTDGPGNGGGDGGGGNGGGDGGSDGGGTGDAGSPDATGCARYPGATFCVDFDGTDPLAVPAWTGNDALQPSPAGTITLTTSAPISAPNAARFELAASANKCRYLRLVKQLPGTFGGIVTRFDMRAEDSSVFFSLGVTISATLSYTLLVALGVDKLVHLFAQQNLNGNITEIGADSVNLDMPWPGRWIDLTLEYKSMPEKSVSLTVPGGRTQVVSLPPSFVAIDPEISIGPFCNGTLTRATFDDFATWATP